MDKDFEKLTEMLQELENSLRLMDMSKFFSLVRNYVQQHPLYPGLLDELDANYSTYQNLLECYANSIDDPQRLDIYWDINDFMIKTYMNILLNESINDAPVLQAAKKRASKINLFELQDILADKEPDNDVYNAVFSAVLVSWMWDEKVELYFLDLMENPHVDIKPKLLIVSAATMSCFVTFDLHKFAFLIDLYRKDIEVELKQRALVGWVLTSCNVDSFWQDDVNCIVADLLDPKETEAENTRNELVALQKQIIFCMDAEKDAMEVDKDIMTHLHAGSVKSILDNDPMDGSLSEIIHPEAEEEMAEKLEQSVFRMAKMEKAGSDVYFHGFSHMKNFAFFHSLYNWFMPFYAQNPLLHRVTETLDGNDTFLKNLETSSPFCESDKYSFAFGMEMTLGSSPALKGLAKENFLFTGMTLSQEGVDGATLARRMYLQDLYRFFRVSPFHLAFDNPFEKIEGEPSSCYFLNCWHESELGNYIGNFEGMLLKICRFLLKRKDYERLSYFVDEADETTDEMHYYLAMVDLHYNRDYLKACACALKLDHDMPDNEKIMKLIARCFTESGMYRQAAFYYEKIMEVKPSDAVKLKLAACYLKSRETEKGMKILYELYYRFPEQPDVLRLLAWGYVLEEKLDKALDIYSKLGDLTKKLKQGQNPDDVYNVGVCYWLAHDNRTAVKWFVRYSQIKTEEDDSLADKLKEDQDTFTKIYHVNFQDVFLMTDLVRNTLNKER